jgi:tetratricopeptide (TPR) repeat protein
LLGAYDQALDWAARSALYAPDHRSTYYHIGAQLLRFNNDSATERFMLRAEQKFKNDERLQMLLCELDALRGRNDAAMSRARRALISQPGDDEAQRNLAEIAIITRSPDARALLQPLAKAMPEARPFLLAYSLRSLYAWTLFNAGAVAEADSLWRDAITLDERELKDGSESWVLPMEIAGISAIRGDTTAAFQWLERGYSAGFRDYRTLRVDPFFDPVRTHTRFREISRRMEKDVGIMYRRAVAEHDTLFSNVDRR